MPKVSKILFNIFIVAVVIFLTLLWLRENDLFVISRVKVVGNKLLTKEEIIELADLDFSQEIFNVDLDDIKERLLTNQLIKDVNVSRYLPSAIKIEIEEKDLIANVAGSKLYVLDSNADIVKTKKLIARYDLPIITGSYFKSDSAGNKVASEQIHEMIKILRALRQINLQLYHDISEINYNKDYGIFLYLRKKAIPIIFGFNDYTRKICYLSTIYNLLQKRNGLMTLKAIDIRFEGQVVVKN